MNIGLGFLLVLMAGFMPLNRASAQQSLSDEELRGLIVGKSVTFRDGTVIDYATDGSYWGSRGAGIFRGRYRIAGSRVCYDLSNDHNWCHRYLKDAQGLYILNGFGGQYRFSIAELRPPQEGVPMRDISITVVAERASCVSGGQYRAQISSNKIGLELRDGWKTLNIDPSGNFRGDVQSLNAYGYPLPVRIEGNVQTGHISFYNQNMNCIWKGTF